MAVPTGPAAHLAAEDPTGQRITAIAERLAFLREQTTAMTERALVAAEHAREIRDAPRSTCNHVQQVAAMQAELDAISRELDGLHTAMNTRGIIEQAKGMLMLQTHCDADSAFAELVHLSQTSHRKVVDVARAIVDSWAGGGHATA